MSRLTAKQRFVLEQLAALPEGETRLASQLGVKQHRVLWRLSWRLSPLIAHTDMRLKTWAEDETGWYITAAGRKAIQ